MLESLPQILLVILGFGLLIVVHELGHFLVAKKVGIRCPQFAVGFGRALCSYRKGVGVRAGSTELEYRQRVSAWLTEHGKAPPATAEADDKKPDPEAPLALRSADLVEAESALGLGATEYRLNWMPLGGYVKMLGQEDLDPNARSDDPQAFNNKSIGARSAVISAGVVVNLIVGVLLFIVAFWIGVPFPAATVGGVVSGSAAATTYAEGHDNDPTRLGLRQGDRVLTVNGDEATDWTQVRLATALGRADDVIALEVERAGEAQPLTYRITPRIGRIDQLLSAGIEPPRSLEVGFVNADKGAAQDAGVAEVMTLTRLGDTPVASWSEVTRALDGSGGASMAAIFTSADGESAPVTLRPRPAMIPAPEGPDSLLGLTAPVRVETVTEGSPAAKAGMQEGDLIARVGSVDWPADIGELSGALRGAGDEPVSIDVWRGDQRVALQPVRTDDGLLGIGIDIALDSPRIARVLEGSVIAEAAEGPPPAGGSKLVEIDGQAVADWADIQAALQQAGERGEARVELKFEENRPGLQTSVFVDLEQPVRESLKAARWSWPHDAVGVGFEADRVVIQGGPLEAVAIGLTKTKESIQQVYIMMARLWQGTVKVKHLRGPVGIVHEGSRVARRGIPWTLFFFGLISVNLAVINFLPIPVVDGGHMVFLAIEKVRGAPAPAAVQTVALVAGLLLIGAVFLATTWHDVGRAWTAIFG
ncbi:MAG: site-2 protease family protein [Planctomycetota bacterium]